MRLALVISLLIKISNGFYVPGIAPREFVKGDRIGNDLLMMLALQWKFIAYVSISEVKAVKMTSTRTQLPYDYYSLNFCLPKNGTLHYKSENLGEVLRGLSTHILITLIESCNLIINS